MNKKFLSVVLFGALMAGSSVTFTGCIDNDEPAVSKIFAVPRLNC